ncbi:MAG: DUF1848 domain-containing protein [Deltaproteobacteria bacterium]|nr:DUF1848 domain-containing protein [Deltaproteobacteria bacterium]
MLTRMERRPLILSASRRTDLPGFHPERLVERIRTRVQGVRSCSLYGVVFWTKHPAPLVHHRELRMLLEELANPVLQLTVTGLGGSRWEPHVPRSAEVLPLLGELVSGPLHGQPARLRWRFDPIWPRSTLRDEFCRLADAFARLGVPTCTFSFPTSFCQLGSMEPVYRRVGLRFPGRAERAEILGWLCAEASARSLRLLSCSQPENLLGPVEEAQCIPREVLEGLHPAGLPFPQGRDPSQRKACRCLVSEDIGRYAEDPCGSGCSYCYSRAGGELGRERYAPRG